MENVKYLEKFYTYINRNFDSFDIHDHIETLGINLGNSLKEHIYSVHTFKKISVYDVFKIETGNLRKYKDNDDVLIGNCDIVFKFYVPCDGIRDSRFGTINLTVIVDIYSGNIIDYMYVCEDCSFTKDFFRIVDENICDYNNDFEMFVDGQPQD